MIRFVRVLAGLISVLSATACSGPSLDLEKHRVVILVVDGLRPDYVTAALMPRLNRLAERGVRGLAHHAVFPTVTRVNGPSIFTGRYPGGHGLLGNSVYLPEVDATRVLDMSDRDDVVAIDEATGGALLTAPSLGELLDAQGVTYFAASSGSTGSATFMNHRGAGAG
ncbi:MAG: alkaline phosphatase family protein, partial [Gemmatimonadota bacterium]